MMRLDGARNAGINWEEEVAKEMRRLGAAGATLAYAFTKVGA